MEDTKPEPRFHVHYEYSGGSGTLEIRAPDADAATRLGMLQAKPDHNPGQSVTHKVTHRILDWKEVETLPYGGVRRAYEVEWDRRDTGGDWLVVERGRQLDHRGLDYWTESGRLVATHKSETAAWKWARETVAKQIKRHNSFARYDVVPRHAVELVETMMPYGTSAGSIGA
jgi:hypothetical protein